MRVLLTQPYVPAYRVPLFNALRSYLKAEGHELIVVAGSPNHEQAKRRDEAAATWIQPMRERTFSVLRGREVRFRRLPPETRAQRFDVMITELDASNTFAWYNHFRHPRTPVVLWGHGASFVSSERAWSVAARRLFVRTVASHVMTYSERGKRMLSASLGEHTVPITSIGNSTDTLTLREALLSLSDAERARAREIVGTGNRALFVGGLDASKRIHQLLESASVARESDPSFKLVIVGDGVLQPAVKAASEAGSVVWVASARGRQLAALASTCDSVWMPGRVGLVAVDALALGLPVISVDHEHHAPEVDFLGEGEIYFVSSNPRAFAEEARLAVGRATSLRPTSALPSVQRVAREMTNVILGLSRATGPAS